MTTLIIFDCGEYVHKYGILEGDYSHLDGTTINSCDDEVKETEACELIYDEDYNERDFLSTDKSALISKEWDTVCEIYFIQ